MYNEYRIVTAKNVIIQFSKIRMILNVRSIDEGTFLHGHVAEI